MSLYDDEFAKRILDCLNPNEQKLRGRPISVDLRIVEVELIRWALNAYKAREFYDVMREESARMERLEFTAEEKRRLHEAIDAGYKAAHKVDGMIELIESKLTEAVEGALSDQERQTELGLEPPSN